MEFHVDPGEALVTAVNVELFGGYRQRRSRPPTRRHGEPMESVGLPDQRETTWTCGLIRFTCIVVIIVIGKGQLAAERRQERRKLGLDLILDGAVHTQDTHHQHHQQVRDACTNHCSKFSQQRSDKMVSSWACIPYVIVLYYISGDGPVQHWQPSRVYGR